MCCFQNDETSEGFGPEGRIHYGLEAEQELFKLGFLFSQDYSEALTESHSVIDLTFYSIMNKMCVLVFSQLQ